MAVAVLFAEIEAGGCTVSQRLADPVDDHRCVFVINKLGGILLDKLFIFGAVITGKFGDAVRVINRFEDIGDFINCDAAGNSVNDILGV